jgi:hypothetical protein
VRSLDETTTVKPGMTVFVGWAAIVLAVAATGVALWFAAPRVYRVLAGLQQEVAVSLLVGVLTVGALAWRRASEVREQREAHLRDQKVPVYEGFLTFWFRVLYQVGKGAKAPSQRELQQHMIDSVPGFVFWASDDVIRKWSELRRQGAAPERDEGLERLLELEGLLLTMRADLGQENANLREGDLLSLWVNDIHETLTARNARRAEAADEPSGD